jgi:hypothetical protein
LQHIQIRKGHHWQGAKNQKPGREKREESKAEPSGYMGRLDDLLAKFTYKRLVGTIIENQELRIESNVEEPLVGSAPQVPQNPSKK